MFLVSTFALLIPHVLLSALAFLIFQTAHFLGIVLVWAAGLGVKLCVRALAMTLGIRLWAKFWQGVKPTEVNENLPVDVAGL